MKSDHRQSLAALQLKIMQVLWEAKKASVHDVFKRLHPQKTLAYTTVATMLHKLEVKGLVRHDTDDRTLAFWSGFVTLLLFFRELFHALLAVRLVRNASRLDHSHMHQLLVAVQSSMRFSKKIQLLVSNQVHVPSAVFGFPNSILLPHDLEKSFSEEEIKVILAHEISHLKYCESVRYDVCLRSDLWRNQ